MTSILPTVSRELSALGEPGSHVDQLYLSLWEDAEAACQSEVALKRDRGWALHEMLARYGMTERDRLIEHLEGKYAITRSSLEVEAWVAGVWGPDKWVNVHGFTWTHHRILSKKAIDPDRRKELARECIEGAWSTRELEDRVRDLCDPGWSEPPLVDPVQSTLWDYVQGRARERFSRSGAAHQQEIAAFVLDVALELSNSRGAEWLAETKLG